MAHHRREMWICEEAEDGIGMREGTIDEETGGEAGTVDTQDDGIDN